MSKYEQALREISSDMEMVSEGWFDVLEKHGATGECADWAITGYVAAWTINVAFKHGLSSDLAGNLNKWTYQKMTALWKRRRNK